MNKTQWDWINPKNSNESATIFYNDDIVLKPYKCIYYSPYGLDYRDNFKSLRGAKASLTRYVGYKTEWKEIL